MIFFQLRKLWERTIDYYHSSSRNHKNHSSTDVWTMIIGDDYDIQGYRCGLWFFLDGSWWFSEDRYHSLLCNQKNWTMIMGDDYDGLWFFWMDHDGFLRIAFIVYHAIIKITELWLWGMTMIDYDCFSNIKIMGKNHWLLS